MPRPFFGPLAVFPRSNNLIYVSCDVSVQGLKPKAYLRAYDTVAVDPFEELLLGTVSKLFSNFFQNFQKTS